MKIMIMVARHVVWQSFRRSGEAFQALAERGRGRRRFNRFNLDYYFPIPLFFIFV